MRSLFRGGNNQIQFGYDFSSLENRIQGHYVYKYEGGPELAETLLAEKPLDLHCYSEDTEILTTEGWKTFDDLTLEDKVLQYDPTNDVSSYVTPGEIVWQPYDGDMVHFEDENTDQLLTPNHRVLYVDHDVFKVGRADELLDSEGLGYLGLSDLYTLPKGRLEPYSGYVGCVSVPSGFVTVRRNGRVFVSGNTINAKKLGIERDQAKALTYA